MFYKMTYVHDTQAAAAPPPPPAAAAAAYRPVVKSASRHHQHHHHRPPHQHPPYPRPFDPDELTRRLYVVLAEQKAYAEMKRRAKAAAEAERQARQVAKDMSGGGDDKTGRSHAHCVKETSSSSPDVPSLKLRTTTKEEIRHDTPVEHHSKTDKASKASSEDSSPSTYRHIPQVAAAQFARTTTVETLADKHLVHKLSRQALKFHLESPNATTGTTAATAPCEQTKALRRAQSIRERQYERNQFQHTHALATTAEVDERAPSQAPLKHALHEYIKFKGLDHEAWRKSTEGRLARIADPAARESAEMPSLIPPENQSACDHYDVIVSVDEHRVDWTQSDETAAGQQKPAAGSHNLLRKAESKWALRSRLGSLSKNSSKSDKLPSPTEDKGSPAESTKSPTTKAGGFFSRFRR